MKILSFFTHPQRSLDWSYTSSANIWRLLFSETGRIIGENRNQDRKQVTFFCLNEPTGDKIWENLATDEPWWVGIEAVQKQMLLLHGFAQPDLPQHKGIQAFDLESAERKWENKELAFWFGYQNTVYAFKTMFERRIGYALDLNTGKILQEFDDTFDELQPVRKLAQEELQTDEYKFPEVFHLADSDQMVKAVMEKLTNSGRVVGDIEFVRDREYLLFNYYVHEKTSTPDSLSLENNFEIVKIESGQKVFSVRLLSGAKAPVPDSFFVKDNVVYFIKDQRTLSALRLWKS